MAFRAFVARHDFVATSEDELPLERGQVVCVFNTDGDWWLGQCGHLVGYFPRQFVDIRPPAPLLENNCLFDRRFRHRKPLPPAPKRLADDLKPEGEHKPKKAVAKMSYDGGKAAHGLSFSEGDVLTVLSAEGSDWYYGGFQGKRGFFPASHVTISESNEREKGVSSPNAVEATPKQNQSTQLTPEELLQKRNRMRARVLQEMLTTESAYVTHLINCKNVYLNEIERQDAEWKVDFVRK